MDLKLGDIQSIYGETFYLVEEEGKNEAPAEKENAPVEAKTEAKQAPVEKVEAKVPAAEEAKPKTANTTEIALAPTGNITWRTKEASQVLFILHEAEIKDKVLGELLKKIVASIGIPFEAAGFGIVKGELNLADWQQMPNPYGVVFDLALQPAGTENPLTLDAGTLFFCNKLDAMKDDQDMKRVLWNYLKGLKEKLN